MPAGGCPNQAVQAADLHLEVTNVASSKFQCQLIYYLCLTGAFYSLWFTDLLACSCIKITHVTVAIKKIKMGDNSKSQEIGDSGEETRAKS